eukprot:GHVT01000578.1.p1 GENE.GHVT01000578.1~~GHVT01000578.1.p1  ORF type:complete len:233 (+),score=38.90 GHVT01000578.1:346-1044(+)
MAPTPSHVNEAKRLNDEDSEAVEDWEELLNEKPAPAPVKAAVAEKNVKKGGVASVYKALHDPKAEKARQQKLVEDGDRRLMDDLFAGCDRPEGHKVYDSPDSDAVEGRMGRASRIATSKDPFESLSLKTLKQCEEVAERLTPRIQEAPAKSPAWLRFLSILLSECAPKMDTKDLTSLSKKVQATIKEKADAQRVAAEKKKPNDSGSRIKNYEDEMHMIYGDLSEEEFSDRDG